MFQKKKSGLGIGVYIKSKPFSDEIQEYFIQKSGRNQSRFLAGFLKDKDNLLFDLWDYVLVSQVSLFNDQFRIEKISLI